MKRREERYGGKSQGPKVRKPGQANTNSRRFSNTMMFDMGYGTRDPYWGYGPGPYPPPCPPPRRMMEPYDYDWELDRFDGFDPRDGPRDG